jgi:hypothetical protein
MMEFMRNGGYAMWVMLVTAVAVAVLAATRKGESRPRVLGAGCVALIIEGILGLSTGMYAVSAKYVLFPDKVDAIAQGLGELANNGTFSAALATLLGIAAIVLRRNPAAAEG